ncbi:FHA domain-containing protein [Microbacterium sp. 22242]|uniref:FHA domain-containing protein n=1 Tax=Microbacterium sp. 22242 TaxID=3453896 RepID=UPI003F876255
MAKQHKLANARIEIDTALSIGRVIEVAVHAVGTQRSLRVIGESENGIRVALNGLLGGALMHFTVTADIVDGRTHAVSEIEQYRTSQTTVYFIPVGPKSMEGIGIYRRFMATFGQAMQAADPSAKIRMIEREDRAPAVSAVAGESSSSSATAVPAVPAVVEVPAAPASAAVPALPAAPAVPEPVAPMPPAESAAASLNTAVAYPDPAPPADLAPSDAPPAAPKAYPSQSAGATTPGGVSESTARTVQIVGGVVVAGGLIFWYTTPSNVTVGPIMVIVLGAVIAGVGFLLGRRANSAAADELAAKLRRERALNAADVPATAAPHGVEVPAAPTSPSAVPPVPAAPAGFAPSTSADTVPPMPAPTGAPAAFPVSSIPPVPLPPVSAGPTPEGPVLRVPAEAGPVVPLPPMSQPAVPVVLPPIGSAPPTPVPPSSEVPEGTPIASVPGFVPSAPTADAVPVPEPATTDADADADDDLDVTRVAPAGGRSGWQVVLNDGRTLTVDSALRFGRDPLVDATDPTVVLVSLQDPAKSISKTHAQVQFRDGELFVIDLRSTNGTVVIADGSRIQVSPERPQVVSGDAELHLGDCVVRIRRSAAGESSR